jgi:type III secretion protein W
LRAPEESLTEKLERAPVPTDDDASPAAAVSRFVQNSDEMAAALRSQFRRRGEVADKLETLGDNFERVLEEDVLPKAMQVLAIARQTSRTLEWALQQARQQFPDASDLVLVLSELLRQRQMPVAARQRLEAMLQAVLHQAPPKRLKAGINCALKARLFGRKLALKAGMMRETYRAFLESDDDPVGCYEDWIALYGAHHRADVLGFIEAALLTDIDAQDPSCSRAEFGQLLMRLGQLKRLPAKSPGGGRACSVSQMGGRVSSSGRWTISIRSACSCLRLSAARRHGRRSIRYWSARLAWP